MNTQSHVQCQACGTRYVFAASEIPDAGYHAACDDCDAHFWVDPHTLAAYDDADLDPDPSPPVMVIPTLDPDGQARIRCAHCEAVYQFPAHDLPGAGYEAACIGCSGLFVLGDAYAAPPSPVVRVPEPVATPDGDAAPLQSVFDEEALGTPAQSEPAVVWTSPEPAFVASPSQITSSRDPHTLLSLDTQLGEPDPPSPGTSLRHDFTVIAQHRRRRQRILGAVGLVVGGGLLGAAYVMFDKFSPAPPHVSTPVGSIAPRTATPLPAPSVPSAPTAPSNPPVVDGVPADATPSPTAVSPPPPSIPSPAAVADTAVAPAAALHDTDANDKNAGSASLHHRGPVGVGRVGRGKTKGAVKGSSKGKANGKGKAKSQGKGAAGVKARNPTRKIRGNRFD